MNTSMLLDGKIDIPATSRHYLCF